MSGTTTTNTCTFTLGGTCCNSLTDVYDFVKKLRDEPLFNDATCCADGTAKDSTCQCEEAKDPAKTCIFDTCFNWPDLYNAIAWLKFQWKAGKLDNYAIYAVTALWGFFGSQGDSVLAERVPIFYSTVGGIVGIISGILSAISIGYDVITTGIAIDQYSTVSQSSRQGSSFIFYGGNSWVGDLLGLTEAFYLIGFLLLGTSVVAAPFELAFKMDMEFQKVDAANITETNYNYLTYGLIMAVGSLLTATAVKKAASKLLGFFNIRDTGATKNRSWLNANAFRTDQVFVDVLYHTLTILSYYAVAAMISWGSYYYVYKNVWPVDQQQF